MMYLMSTDGWEMGREVGDMGRTAKLVVEQIYRKKWRRKTGSRKIGHRDSGEYYSQSIYQQRILDVAKECS
jgi:hypothetical protein